MPPLLELLERLKHGQEKYFKGLGALSTDKHVYFYYYAPHAIDHQFRLAVSEDGFNFSRSEINPTLFDQKSKVLPISSLSFVSFSQNKDNNYLIYSKSTGLVKEYFIASSNHLTQWKTQTKLFHITEDGIIVSNFTYKKRYIMIYGEYDLKMAYSYDFKKWYLDKKFILKSRKDQYDCFPLKAEFAFATKKGVLLLYSSGNNIGLTLLDAKDPAKIIWRSESPIWELDPKWLNKKFYNISTILFKEKIIGYWGLESDAIYAVIYSLLGKALDKAGRKKITLKKVKENPILVPRKEYQWDSVAVFNPAALYDQGKVHLLYRAIGDNYLSVLGYASSINGIRFSQRSEQPVYKHIPTNNQSNNSQSGMMLYWSGGGFGGCEDPRLTKIGNRIYMTYIALENNFPPRIAITSISLDDFRNQRWLWERPVIISPPDVVDKNAVIFPEKIRGKYVIMHRIFPNILIDFVDNLNFDGSTWLKGEYRISPRPNMWDSRKVGAGAPPIKTKYGWLLIYHAVDDRNASKYKMGAMLLDLDNPVKVLHRTNSPILEPSEKYENEGYKFGVAYPCGAVIFKENLYVYYGGADMVTCVATANLENLLIELRTHETITMQPVSINKISNL